MLNHFIFNNYIHNLFNFKINPIALDCPQKVRHYLGVFLWEEKSQIITATEFNFVVFLCFRNVKV